jgi:CRP-like cAMP-binding protein
MEAAARPGSHFLPHSQFLVGLPRSDVEEILNASTQQHFSARSVIVHQEAAGNRFFLLYKGRARYFFNTANGKKVLLMWIIPGDIFGAIALTHTLSRYVVSTEAVRDCTTLSWDRDHIRRLALRFPRILENSIAIGSQYLSWYAETHAALTSKTAAQRLASILLGLSRLIGQEVPGGLEIDVTNDELANAANITHYTACRMISEWQKRGLVHKDRGRIVLCFPERLHLHLP